MNGPLHPSLKITFFFSFEKPFSQGKGTGGESCCGGPLFVGKFYLLVRPHASLSRIHRLISSLSQVVS